MREKDDLLQIVEDLKKDRNRLESLIKDRERLEKRIEEIERATERLVKLVSLTDDQAASEIYEREIKNLAEQRRSIDESLQDVQLMILDAEKSLPNTPAPIELHNQFAWEDENWTNEQKRDYLLSGGFRVYSDGKKFEIRLHTGKVVANFDESSTSLVAYGTNPSYRQRRSFRRSAGSRATEQRPRGRRP
jgi:chaperonin cofactor prefoldin